MPKFNDDVPSVLRKGKKIRIEMKNLSQDKVLIGGMTADVTR